MHLFISMPILVPMLQQNKNMIMLEFISGMMVLESSLIIQSLIKPINISQLWLKAQLLMFSNSKLK